MSTTIELTQPHFNRVIFVYDLFMVEFFSLSIIFRRRFGVRQEDMVPVDMETLLRTRVCMRGAVASLYSE